tara:strand:- start:25 stop:930 length:906 start_codon:yes stop_codon:yes gene_type:complete
MQMSNYDTGIIDSDEVQRQFPKLFRQIMCRLKKRLFTNYQEPWSDYTAEELECLNAMKNIGLVVIDGDMVRLIQACDYLELGLKEQKTQKSELDDVFYFRGTDTSERDTLKLGEGCMDLTSSFWSNCSTIAEEYGRVLVKTRSEEILKIADLSIQRPWNKFVQYSLIEIVECYVRDMTNDSEIDIEDIIEKSGFGNENEDDVDPDSIEDIVCANLRIMNKLKDKYTLDMVNEIKNASYLLGAVGEINFVYHPWVTTEEIQRSRTYTNLKRKKMTSNRQNIKRNCNRSTLRREDLNLASTRK